jgi:hypothetical protein
MNIENLTRLRDEILTRTTFHFDMSKGLVADADGSDWCNSTCCIAGLAFALSAEPALLSAAINRARKRYAETELPGDLEVEWAEVREGALRWLGIEPDTTWEGHPLFAAPRVGNVDRKRAAEAIDRVIQGQHPWK